MSWFDWNRKRDEWHEAPRWVRRVRDDMAIIMAQNETILAWLEDRPPQLSPEDQAAINEIFAIEDSDRKKLDAAAKPKE